MKPSAAQALAALASPAVLSHTPDGKAYAHIQVGVDGQAHEEFWPVKSRPFKGWLRRAFFLAEGKPAPAQAMAETIDLIEAQALEAKQVDVHVRVAEHEGHVYIDLCDPAWRVVEITPAGWTIVARPPVAFRRAPGMLALPAPVRGGSLDTLRTFINLADDYAWRLLKHWLLMTVHPLGPYPVLSLTGEQGAAKSTTATVLRNLVDPNSAPLRSEPREPRDLMIAANNGRIITLDNVSHLPGWLSDSLCRLATGGGFSTRELYSDEDEVIFSAKRPIILTSIEGVIVRGDLMDRSVLIELPAIAPEHRREEAEFWAQFERARPELFGAILAAVAGALRALPTVRLTRRPRLADFAKWSVAAEQGQGWSGFSEAYHANVEGAHEVVVDSSPVGQAIRGLVDDGDWEGLISELLETLSNRAAENTRRSKAWPTSARALSGALRRLAPNLRALDIDVTFPERTKRGQPVRIGKRPTPPTSPAPSQQDQADSGVGRGVGTGVGVGRPHDGVGSTFTTQVPGNVAANGNGVGGVGHEPSPDDDGSAGLSSAIDAMAEEEQEEVAETPAPDAEFICTSCNRGLTEDELATITECSHCHGRTADGVCPDCAPLVAFDGRKVTMRILTYQGCGACLDADSVVRAQAGTKS